MPPHKVAAKKSAAKKSAGKKTAANSVPHHDDAKDLRRAFEHLGRVSALHPLLGAPVPPIAALTRCAEQQLAAQQPKNAADLLRAAEHLSFAQLGAAQADTQPGAALLEALREEFAHKLAKAEKHWRDQKEPSPALLQIFERACAEAREAFDAAAYGKALELVRAAEALAHVHLLPAKPLPAGAGRAVLPS